MQLTVNRDVGEMPDGAIHSDDDEGDNRPLDDPHRALNIDLDVPLSPSEVLPTQHHRIPVNNNLTLNGEDEKNSKKSKAKKKTSKSDKRKGTDEVGNKIRKQRSIEEKERDLIKSEYIGIDGSNENETGNEECLMITDGNYKSDLLKDGSEDLLVVTEKENAIKKVKKHKKSKPEKKNDLSKKKKKTKKSKGGGDLQDLIGGLPTKDAYQEITSTNGCESLMEIQSDFMDLAQDSQIKLSFKLRQDDSPLRQLFLAMKFTNLSCQDGIDNLQISFPAMNGVKINGKNGMKIDFSAYLKPLKSLEQDFELQVEDDAIPYKFKGQLNYKLAFEKKCMMNFTLFLPVTCFLSGVTASKSAFTNLLGSGQLTARSSFTIPDYDYSFNEVLQVMTGEGNLCIVEHVDQTASLYAQSMSGSSVCLLIKIKDFTRLTVDGKSSNNTLLANTLDYLKQRLQAKA